MKLGRYDSFIIGVCLAFSISLFFEKDYLGIAIQGFLLGLYFGIGLVREIFASHEKTGVKNGC